MPSHRRLAWPFAQAQVPRRADAGVRHPGHPPQGETPSWLHPILQAVSSKCHAACLLGPSPADWTSQLGSSPSPIISQPNHLPALSFPSPIIPQPLPHSPHMRVLRCVSAPQVRPEEVELIRRDYTANGGWETFLEYGDPRQVGGRQTLALGAVVIAVAGCRRHRSPWDQAGTPGGHARSSPAASFLAVRQHGPVAPPSAPSVAPPSTVLWHPPSTVPWHPPPSLQDILVGLLRLRKVAGPDAQRQPELRGRCSVVGGSCTRSACRASTLAAHAAPLVLVVLAANQRTQSDLPVACLRSSLCSVATAHLPHDAQVRELHVYGTAVAVHARDSSKFQHQVGLCCCSPFIRPCVLPRLTRRQAGAHSLAGCPPPSARSTAAGSTAAAPSPSVPAGLRHAAHVGGGAHCALRAPLHQAGGHLGGGHAPLLPQAGVRWSGQGGVGLGCGV